MTKKEIIKEIEELKKEINDLEADLAKTNELLLTEITKTVDVPIFQYTNRGFVSISKAINEASLNPNLFYITINSLLDILNSVRGVENETTK